MQQLDQHICTLATGIYITTELLHFNDIYDVRHSYVVVYVAVLLKQSFAFGQVGTG